MWKNIKCFLVISCFMEIIPKNNQSLKKLLYLKKFPIFSLSDIFSYGLFLKTTCTRYFIYWIESWEYLAHFENILLILVSSKHSQQQCIVWNWEVPFWGLQNVTYCTFLAIFSLLCSIQLALWACLMPLIVIIVLWVH